jgi:SSS family solute:Na+ symporter
LLELVPAGFAGLPTDAAMYCILIPVTAILMIVHHFTQKTTHDA